MKPGGGGGFPVSSFICQTIKCLLDICVFCPAALPTHLSASPLFLLLHWVLSLYPFCHGLSWSEGLPKQAENDDRQHSSTQTRIL